MISQNREFNSTGERQVRKILIYAEPDYDCSTQHQKILCFHFGILQSIAWYLMLNRVVIIYLYILYNESLDHWRHALHYVWRRQESPHTVTFTPASHASRDAAGGFCSSCQMSESQHQVLPPGLGGTQPPQPSSSSFENMQSYLRRLAGLAESLWNQFLELQRSWRGAGLGGQNVLPSPFYTPLLFGTKLPKADGCADSLQIRADLRSSQRPNQKQLSLAGLKEGLCCPLLAPQENVEGIYFIRFIYTRDFFGQKGEEERSEHRFKWGIGALLQDQTVALCQFLDLESQQNFIALRSD